MKVLFTAFLLLLAPGVSFAGKEISVVEREPLPDLGLLLHDADSIVVYEGLPHTLFERAAFDDEKKTKKVFNVGGDFFYEKRLSVSAEDIRSIDNTFRMIAVSSPFRGEKLCGGFHADYMPEWKKKDTVVARVLLCFGCHEMKIVAGDKSYRAELTKEGAEALLPILRNYRQERPIGSTTPAKPKHQPPPPPKVELQLSPSSAPQ